MRRLILAAGLAATFLATPAWSGGWGDGDGGPHDPLTKDLDADGYSLTDVNALSSTQTTDVVITEQTNGGGDKTSQNGRWHATQFNSGTATETGAIVISVKAASIPVDSSSYFQCEIYDNNAGPTPDTPGSPLTKDWDHSTTSYKLADVGATYSDFTVIAPYTLTPSTLYWVVCKTTLSSGTVQYQYGIPGGYVYSESDDAGSSWTSTNTQSLVFKVLERRARGVEVTRNHAGAVWGWSDDWLAVRGQSLSGMAMYGTSLHGFGVGVYSRWIAGVRGSSTYGPGLEGWSTDSIGGRIITQITSGDILQLLYTADGATFDTRDHFPVDGGWVTKSKATPEADVSGYGEWWVKSGAPTFTYGGTDYTLGGSGQCTQVVSVFLDPTEARVTDDYVDLVDNTVSATVTDVDDFVVPVGMYASHLSVTEVTDPGAANQWNVALIDDGTPNSLTCSIANGGTSCADDAHVASIAAGSDLNVWVTSALGAGAPATTSNMRIAFCLGPAQ